MDIHSSSIHAYNYNIYIPGTYKLNMYIITQRTQAYTQDPSTNRELSFAQVFWLLYSPKADVSTT